MTSNRSPKESSFLQTFIWGALPIAIVCVLLASLGSDEIDLRSVGKAIFVVCGVVLWFGRGAMRGNAVTKWFGIFLAILVGLVVGLWALGLVLGLTYVGLSMAELLLIPFFIGLPFVLYDLLFRAPAEGRSARRRFRRSHPVP